jgi:protein gp37
MAEITGIAWCDSTLNPWIGCTKVSEECDDWYAETWSNRFDFATWGPHGERKPTKTWKQARRMQRGAAKFFAKHKRRRRLFCPSMADPFDNQVPEIWRREFFQTIRECPDIDWLLLTKRPQNIVKMLPEDWGNGYSNVWLGVSAGKQEYYDQRWPILQKVPARIRFISYEPALGPVRLPTSEILPDWVIRGGKSGRQERPIDPQWARGMRDDCREANVAFFMKQMNGRAKRELDAIPADLMVREFPS